MEVASRKPAPDEIKNVQSLPMWLDMSARRRGTIKISNSGCGTLKANMEASATIQARAASKPGSVAARRPLTAPPKGPTRRGSAPSRKGNGRDSARQYVGQRPPE
jgi:hypothetical protein